VLLACQPGFETFLVKELNLSPLERGAGWVRAADGPASGCFPHWTLKGDEALEGASAKAAAQALVDYFLRTSVGETYAEPWPLVVEGGGEDGAARRAHTVEELFLELGRKRMSRVVKLARPGRPGPGPKRGLFAFLTSLGTLRVAREAEFGGQRRMADDPRAPSRSYLKAEEAFAALGEGPKEGESVVDLGAAPGGWSFSAAKRGARVLAVDNGPLKGGALGHALIEHRAEDAFKLEPRAADWLLCDMLEDPERVLALISRWRAAGARRLVVNLKFGRLDPLPLLRKARAAFPGGRCLHLFHDRDEFTVLL
jgi:23S rRNA (cytidine2498-2'-O)-methyltransferase